MIIIPDQAETFPACPTYGFESVPNYLVKITAKEGGFEKRDRKWSRPLHAYSGTPLGDRPEGDIEEILDFWHAMGGTASGFRFRDWIDYKSCRRGVVPAATDMPLIIAKDSPRSYRLIKEYATKTRRTIQIREILRPIGSPYSDRVHDYPGILIANDAGEVQADWTLDEATGLLTAGPTFAGTPTAWGGEFDVWSRFSAPFNPSITNLKVLNATVQLCEIRASLP